MSSGGEGPRRPRWVRWMIRDGLTRSKATMGLWLVIVLAPVSLLLELTGRGGSLLGPWSVYVYPVAFALLAVWFGAAFRWIDRNGVWPPETM
jgi:hypothetical protein